MIPLVFLSFASIYTTDVDAITTVAGQYDSVTYDSIRKSISDSFAEVKNSGRRVIDSAVSAWNKFPKVKAIAVGTAALATTIVWAATRDLIHDKLMYIYSLKCENGIAIGENCQIKTYVSGIDSYWGMKRISVYLVGGPKKILLVNSSLKKFMSHTTRSETYPYVGFGEVEIPFIMPIVQKGSYQLEVIIHWWPFEKLLATQDISNPFTVAETPEFKRKHK